MQKMMLVENASGVDAVNEILQQDEFEVSSVVSDGNGRWLVLFDDSLDLFNGSDFDLDYDDEDEDEDED